jgi:hypothetical protein
MAPRKTELDTEIERLHGLPLGEFTGARNALAKRLRKAGDADAADYVQALPKPTASAWAVNELFQREPERMETLLAAGRQARSAQGQTISGRGTEALRSALREARGLVDDLRRRAVEILSEAGRAPGGPIVDRVGTNLQALAFSPASAEAAQRGWLSADLDPPGFEVLAGLQLAAVPARKPEPRPAAQAAPKAKEKAKEKAKPGADAKRAKQEEEARKQDEEKAARERREREEAAQRERVKRARAGVQEAESRADFLRRKAEQAERVAAEASRRAEEAGQAAAEARERFEEADAALTQAREELEAARAPSKDEPKEKPSRPRGRREGSR